MTMLQKIQTQFNDIKFASNEKINQNLHKIVVDFTRFIAVTFHHQNLVKNIIFLYAIVVHNFRVSDGKNIAVSTSQIIQMSALSKKKH
jgi:hypothetical protein